MRNALIWAIVAYAGAAAGGYFAVMAFSSNRHDRATEAAMSSIFVFGPVAAVAGCVIGYFRS